MRHVLTTAVIASLISASTFAAKDYYKWVDEDGVTHYSARKPHDVNSEKISVSTGLPLDASGQPVQIDDDAESAGGQNQAAADPEANKDPERCEAAQNNLRIINQNARIRERQADGEIRYLTQEEIEQRKAQAEQAIEESC